ncbi:Gfo/Idh/MocA family oxidoreductase [Leucobacter sp. gxy201]|uniref:Gfo/Idh/MocA family protein n=1 Tax=Leucobacter sp. gxy201 TaxID=2957200 RepID=UPI003DA139D2
MTAAAPTTADALRIPDPRTPAPETAPVLNWGVIGPGRIAEQFVSSLTRHSTQRVAAIASRDEARARTFADKHGIDRAYGSTEAMLASPGIDVVYVATPHVFHREGALAALNAGKHVLVEKPLAMNAAEAEEIARAAQDAGLFAMEAMWPRFLPVADSIRQLLETGALGEVRHLRADLGEYFAPDPAGRLFDPALGGGSPLDLGVYLTAFSSFVFGGAPCSVTATGRRAFTGVVADAAFALEYPTGSAQLYTTLETRTPTAAFIAGSRATLAVGSPFYAPSELTLTAADGSESVTRSFEPQSQTAGLCYEAAAVARAIDAGLTQSELLTPADSIASLRVLDEIEAAIPGA